jgi:glutathione S-transferase
MQSCEKCGIEFLSKGYPYCDACHEEMNPSGAKIILSPAWFAQQEQKEAADHAFTKALDATDSLLRAIQTMICGIFGLACIIGGFLWWPLWILALVFFSIAGNASKK